MVSLVIKRILYIVEGLNDEPWLINKLHESCFGRDLDDFEVYVYETNIHQLAPKLVSNGVLDEDLEIRLTLKSNEQDPQKKELLGHSYNEIYMIFDFDPQQCDNRKQAEEDFRCIRAMLQYYQDPILVGKLYINYPMIQSYKHHKCLPDRDFYKRTVSHSDVLHYKEHVNIESDPKLLDLRNYSYSTFISLAVHHLRKAFFILWGTFVDKDQNDYLNIDYIKIFDYQVNLWLDEEKCSVLNTSLFLLIDYQPKAFFTQITTHSADYLI